MFRDTLEIQTPGKGLHEVTDAVRRSIARAGLRSGLCVIFLQHTSASLVIQENADPSARLDLEYFFNRLAPESDPSYTHTAEGPDDMPSHIRAALLPTSHVLLVEDGAPILGTWQGLYLFEHRTAPHRRVLHLRMLGEGE